VQGTPFKVLIGAVTLAYFYVLLNIGNISLPAIFFVMAIVTGALAPMFSTEKGPLVYVLLFISFLFLALGLLIYIYMPIRATAYAPLHWGVPNTWERFSNVVLRKQYAGFAQVGNVLDISYRIEQLLVWFKWRGEAFTWPVLLLVIPGLFSLFRRDRRWFWFTLSFILFYDIGLLIFNNFRDTPRDKFFAEVFWIPSYIITAIWLAHGVQWLAVHAVKLTGKIGIADKRLSASLVLLVSFVLAGFQGVHNFGPNNNHNNWENDNYGRNMMMTLDKNAILFTEGGDNQVFSLLYHHLVEHMRPDITVWDQKGNVFEGLYGDLMRINQRQLEENYITGDYSQWATERPIYYTWKDYNRIEEINKRYYTGKGLPRRDFQTVGILYRIVPSNVTYTPPIDYWDYYKFLWKDLEKQAVQWDYLAREIIANYNFQYGDRYLAMADELRQAYNSGKQVFNGIPRKEMPEKIRELEDLGFKYYSDASKFGYDMVAIHFNNAIFLEQRAVQFLRERNNEKALELYDQAIERYKKAIVADKGEVRSYNNLAMVYEKKANLDWRNETNYLREAKKILEKGLKINPNFDQAKNNLQRIYGKLEFPITKIDELQKAISANPTDKPAVDRMVDALLKRGEIDMAEQFLESILRYYPNELGYYQILASINAQLQRADRTIYYLERMGSLQPGNPAIWYNIAEIQLRAGQVENAIRNYSKTIQLGQANSQFGQIVNNAQKRLAELQNRR
jgi:tetratricopeptide (TPR) repeat protein